MTAARDMRRLPITPIAPVGKRLASGFVRRADGCSVGTFETDEYPASPAGEHFRKLRIGRDLSLRETARILGISPVDLSALENGRASTDWDAMEDLLDAAL